jgi:hypothetical protein
MTMDDERHDTEQPVPAVPEPEHDPDMDPRGPNERDARDRMIPAGGAGSSGAPFLAATLLGDSYDNEEKRDPEDETTG